MAVKGSYQVNNLKGDEVRQKDSSWTSFLCILMIFIITCAILLGIGLYMKNQGNGTGTNSNGTDRSSTEMVVCVDGRTCKSQPVLPSRRPSLVESNNKTSQNVSNKYDKHETNLKNQITTSTNYPPDFSDNNSFRDNRSSFEFESTTNSNINTDNQTDENYLISNIIEYSNNDSSTSNGVFDGNTSPFETKSESTTNIYNNGDYQTDENSLNSKLNTFPYDDTSNSYRKPERNSFFGMGFESTTNINDNSDNQTKENSGIEPFSNNNTSYSYDKPESSSSFDSGFESTTNINVNRDNRTEDNSIFGTFKYNNTSYSYDKPRSSSFFGTGFESTTNINDNSDNQTEENSSIEPFSNNNANYSASYSYDKPESSSSFDSGFESTTNINVNRDNRTEDNSIFDTFKYNNTSYSYDKPRSSSFFGTGFESTTNINDNSDNQTEDNSIFDTFKYNNTSYSYDKPESSSFFSTEFEGTTNNNINDNDQIGYDPLTSRRFGKFSNNTSAIPTESESTTHFITNSDNQTENLLTSISDMFSIINKSDENSSTITNTPVNVPLSRATSQDSYSIIINHNVSYDKISTSATPVDSTAASNFYNLVTNASAYNNPFTELESSSSENNLIDYSTTEFSLTTLIRDNAAASTSSDRFVDTYQKLNKEITTEKYSQGSSDYLFENTSFTTDLLTTDLVVSADTNQNINGSPTTEKYVTSSTEILLESTSSTTGVATSELNNNVTSDTISDSAVFFSKSKETRFDHKSSSKSFRISSRDYDDFNDSDSVPNDIDEISSSTSLPLAKRTSSKKSSNGRASRHVCETASCKSAASRILSLMNHSEDPCEDFYEFSCGGMQADKDDLDYAWSKLSEEVNLIDKNAAEHLQKLKTFYDSCVAFEKKFHYNERIEEVKKLVKEVGEMTDASTSVNLTALFAKLILRQSLPILDVQLDIDKQTSKLIFKIGLPKKIPVLAGRDHEGFARQIQTFLEKQRRSQLINLTEVYVQYLEQQKNHSDYLESLETTVRALDFFSNPFNLSQRVRSIKTTVKMNILDKLDNISPRENEQAFVFKNYTIYKISDLQQNYPVIQWKSLFSLLTDKSFEDSTTVQVYFNEYLSRILEEIGKLKTEINNALIAMYAHDLYETLVVPQDRHFREKYCLKLSSELFPDIFNSLYVKTWSKSEIERFQNKIINVFKTLKLNFETLLEKSHSFDSSAKNQFLNKLNDTMLMFYNLDKNNDVSLNLKYAKVSLNTTNWPRNAIEMLETNRKNVYSLEGSNFSLNYVNNILKVYSAYPTAIYQNNLIVVPLGMAKQPVSDVPGYITDIRIELSLAREIGRHFDPEGINYKMHLRDESLMHYDFIQDYARMVFFDTTRSVDHKNVSFDIDSTLSSNERIADNTALSLISQNFWDPKNRQIDEELPWLSTLYSKKAVFFISVAQEYCQMTTISKFMRQLFETPVLPSVLRVYNIMSNSKYFAETFQCKKGSAMNINYHSKANIFIDSLDFADDF